MIFLENDIYSNDNIKVTAAERTVQTPPLTLPTPGKADVVVTILVDPDGYVNFKILLFSL